MRAIGAFYASMIPLDRNPLPDPPVLAGHKLKAVSSLPRDAEFHIILGCVGGIAQLGERLHGMQEVIGSIPFTSTITDEDSFHRPHRLEA